MFVLGIVGVVVAGMGFKSGLDYGLFEAWLLSAPGIAMAILALVRIDTDIDRLVE